MLSPLSPKFVGTELLLLLNQGRWWIRPGILQSVDGAREFSPLPQTPGGLQTHVPRQEHLIKFEDDS